MNETCDICTRPKTRVALPWQMDIFRCLPCTPTTVIIPQRRTKREAAVLEHYDEMPLPGRNDGDTYYITSINSICRWDAKKQDYQILPIDAFRWPKPEDEFNDRRGAILAQKARKKSCGTS